MESIKKQGDNLYCCLKHPAMRSQVSIVNVQLDVNQVAAVY